MIRRHPLRSWAPVIVLGCALMLTGCPSDPYDPQTWIEKLDDPAEFEGAVTELQRLKDPVAIKPLAQAWAKNGKQQRVLKVIIELAERPDKGGPHWENALPVLRTAVDDFDVGDQRSIENAIAAASALGNAKDKESIPTLVRAVNKSIPKLSPGQRVRLAAIEALGKIGDDDRAVNALIGVLTANPDDQLPNLFAAAALALADARDPSATVPLLQATYKIAPIYSQTRRALIAIGKPVIPELIKIFKGEQKDMSALAKEYKFNIDCDREMGPGTKCVAPTNLEYKAGLLLGDLRAKEAVPVLIAELQKKPMPAFFEQDFPGPNQHTAVLDALRKIGDPSAADAVYEYMFAEGTDDGTRPIAIDVYSFLTTDTKALAPLATRIKDDGEEEQVRMAAGLTYARLVRSDNDYDPLVFMIDRYKKEADKNEAGAKKANNAFEKAKKAYEEADKQALANKDDKKAAEAVKKARSEKDAKEQEKNFADGRVAGYRNLQRTFEQHLARAHSGVTCKSDPTCYIGLVDKDVEAFGKELAKYIPDFKSWSDDEKKALKMAAVDRAMIELGKMDDKARPVFDKLLELADSTDRIIREGVLMVLVNAAELPCDKCVTRLTEVIEKQEKESTLQALVVETLAVRNYFYWAGR